MTNIYRLQTSLRIHLTGLCLQDLQIIMENIFRIAFLMLFLSVGLQGSPATNFLKIAKGIERLQINITCPEEGTFFYAPSPADVEKSIAGALACSIQQLSHLNDNTNLQHHINRILTVLQKTSDDIVSLITFPKRLATSKKYIEIYFLSKQVGSYKLVYHFTWR
uniref:Uncharacterized protein n=1 Tax=Oncorhynchus kisutch TaxID=8019 RepID=A0A8C7IZQ8_ONCKI